LKQKGIRRKSYRVDVSENEWGSSAIFLPNGAQSSELPTDLREVFNALRQRQQIAVPLLARPFLN
jgi:hypothetical protein